MTKNEIACRIADAMLARGATGRLVPSPGTMGDLLRDYERAVVNEQIEAIEDNDDDEDFNDARPFLGYTPGDQ